MYSNTFEISHLQICTGFRKWIGKKKGAGSTGTLPKLGKPPGSPSTTLTEYHAIPKSPRGKKVIAWVIFVFYSLE